MTVVPNADQSISSPKAGDVCFTESVMLIALGTGPSSKLTKQGLPPHYLEWEIGPHVG